MHGAVESGDVDRHEYVQLGRFARESANARSRCREQSRMCRETDGRCPRVGISGRRVGA